MSLKDWWRDIKGLFIEPKKRGPKKPFIPPHASQPDGKPQPEWPPKEERK